MKPPSKTSPIAARSGPGSEEFQLPLLGLYADLEAGRGSVQLPEDFLCCSPAVQLEVLAGWQLGLAEHRSRALQALFTDLTARHPELAPEQRLSLFRTTCQSLGIELPGDFSPPAGAA